MKRRLITAAALATLAAVAGITTDPTHDRQESITMKNPDPFPSLRRELADLRAQIAKTRSPFHNTGLSPDGTGGLELRGVPLEPMIAANAYEGAAGFGVTVAGADVVTAEATVPAGCSRVIITASGRVMATNSTAGSDQLYTSISIEGLYPSQFPTGVGPGSANTSVATRTKMLEDLAPGDVITVGIFASTGAADWAASGANGADLSVTYLFLR